MVGVIATGAVLLLLGGLGLVQAASAAAGCAAGSSVTVVAHPDDDLFFVNPAILHDIQAGMCSTTVFATSGDSGDDSGYYQSREDGMRAAYATMAGVADSWTSERAVFGGHSVTQLTLTSMPTVQLVFLRLPDGNLGGSGFPSTGYATMERLYRGEIGSVPTVDTPRQTYTLQQIVDTVGAVMTSVGATVVRTLDNVRDFDEGDHSDHIAVARLATSARDRYAPAASLTGYAGYPGGDLEPNVSGDDLAGRIAAFEAYAPYDWNMCLTYSECVAEGRVEPLWLQRNHPVSVSGGVPDPGPAEGDGNVARAASVTASSQNAATAQLATKAVDGTVDGYPNDYTAEWATQGGGSGSWLQLTWSAAVQVDEVVLFDRPNGSDRVTGGTLTFSDGSTVAVPSLSDDGAATRVGFPARATTSLRLTVTSVSSSTSNIGLAELQAWTPGTSTAAPTTTAPTTTAPTTSAAPTTTPSTTTAAPTTSTSTSTSTAAPGTTNLAASAAVSASSQNTATGQLAVRAVDGAVDGYPGNATGEWATIGGGAGSWLQLSWNSAVSVGRVVLHDRPNGNDQVTAATITFSDGTSVAVGVLDNGAGAVTLTFPVRSVTMLRITITSVSGTTENVGLAELAAYAA